MPYDDENVFAKILRGDIPCRRIFEDEYALAFHDINPQAPVHALVIPKGKYLDAPDFYLNAPPDEVAGFGRAVVAVTQKTGVAETGYRLIANIGAHSHQEVPHYHVHVLGGRPLGAMLPAGP
jgi:diadenosine tetraphosphate (Ap4A) HIT family hydrolase